MRRKNLQYSGEGKIRKVLVVDGVELVQLHQLDKMGELESSEPIVGEKLAHTSNEVVDVRHVREDIVAQNKPSGAIRHPQLFGHVSAEEAVNRRYSLRDCCVGDAGGRLDAEAAYTALDKVLQQITV